eukprot:2154348-Rhodomonas_salina.1
MQRRGVYRGEREEQSRSRHWSRRRWDGRRPAERGGEEREEQERERQGRCWLGEREKKGGRWGERERESGRRREGGPRLWEVGPVWPRPLPEIAHIRALPPPSRRIPLGAEHRKLVPEIT